MMQSVAKRITATRLPVDWIVSAVSLGSFAWLLFQDRVHPLMVCLVELYLAF